MRYFVFVLFFAACATPPPPPSPVPAATVQTERVDVHRFNGQHVGSLAPRESKPDLQNGPFVTVRFKPQEAGKTADGQSVVGMRFVAWREQNLIVVGAYALLSNDPKQTANLTGVLHIGNYEVHPGEQVRMVTMEDLGLVPMVLRGAARVEG